MSADNRKAAQRPTWVFRALGLAAVFVVWLLFGGSLSITGFILGAFLVGGGGLMIWLSYRKGQDR